MDRRIEFLASILIWGVYALGALVIMTFVTPISLVGVSCILALTGNIQGAEYFWQLACVACVGGLVLTLIWYGILSLLAIPVNNYDRKMRAGKTISQPENSASNSS